MAYEHDLDSAAKANLTWKGVAEYERYKRSLIDAGTPPDALQEILTGFIWDEAGSEAQVEHEPEPD